MGYHCHLLQSLAALKSTAEHQSLDKKREREDEEEQNGRETRREKRVTRKDSRRT